MQELYKFKSYKYWKQVNLVNMILINELLQKVLQKFTKADRGLKLRFLYKCICLQAAATGQNKIVPKIFPYFCCIVI